MRILDIISVTSHKIKSQIKCKNVITAKLSSQIPVFFVQVLLLPFDTKGF